MKEKRWLILFCLLVFSGFTMTADAAVQTFRDDKGVFFIKGEATDSLYDVFEAMGYAVAEDRLWQAESFRRAAKGQLAAILGPDFLQQDMLVRMTGYSGAELTAGYNNLDNDAKMMIDGYVAGFNRRIAEITANAAIRPFEFHALKFVPEPWTPEDVMAWQALMLRQFDPEAQKQGQLHNAALLQYLTTVFGPAAGMGMFDDLRWKNDPSATTYIPGSEAHGVSAFTAAFGPSYRTAAPRLSPAAMPDADLEAVAANLENLWTDREEKLKNINAFAAMGSYAWVVSGDKTASGRPIIYSGPQMGFDTPAIIMEGSIDAAGLKVSGMAIAGLPGIVIGRTPHHAWSMQVGHARTTDYYFEPPPAMAPAGYYTSRSETIQVAGQGPVTIQVYRSPHGPIVSPTNFNPGTYDMAADGPIVAWRYAHWNMELGTISAYLRMTRAQSMDEFGAALEDVGVSQHFCYADTEGNIAYWMSGVDYVRPNQNAQGLPVDWRLPQGMFFPDVMPAEWTGVRRPLSTDRNTPQGFYAGWNNKTSVDYGNAYNNTSYYFGPFHRAHVLEEYLSANDNLTFEEIRDLALNIATTDSFGGGGNPWEFVKDDFENAVTQNATPARSQALAVMADFDGHFVAGGPDNWAAGMDRSDAWMLADAWIREVINLTFLDELGASSIEYNPDAEPNKRWKNPQILFNVLVRALAGEDASVVNKYNWFQNADPAAPQTAEEIIVAALDNALAALGEQPWGIDKRGWIEFNHPMLNNPPVALNPVHRIPFSSRSTYAHCVEMGKSGPRRIESMFPLGQSGDIRGYAVGTELNFDRNFFSMTEVYDDFSHRRFRDETGKSGSTCFIMSLMNN
jgi:penicillin G amidase